ncbi:MAG: hypothetical protein SVG88_09405 [Halobacteriales archaeon]|nr:hypothetical protein [Halobacteriales archaeon]
MAVEDEDGDPSDLEARIEQLEETVDRLESEVRSRERALSLLIAKADIETLSATCPNCGEAQLKQRSGISWSKAHCPNCSTEWLL